MPRTPPPLANTIIPPPKQFFLDPRMLYIDISITMIQMAVPGEQQSSLAPTNNVVGPGPCTTCGPTAGVPRR